MVASVNLLIKKMMMMMMMMILDIHQSSKITCGRADITLATGRYFVSDELIQVEIPGADVMRVLGL